MYRGIFWCPCQLSCIPASVVEKHIEYIVCMSACLHMHLDLAIHFFFVLVITCWFGYLFHNRRQNCSGRSRHLPARMDQLLFFGLAHWGAALLPGSTASSRRSRRSSQGVAGTLAASIMTNILFQIPSTDIVSDTANTPQKLPGAIFSHGEYPDSFL